MPWHSLRTAVVSCSFVMVGMANGSEIAVETVVEAAGRVEMAGGAVVGGGAVVDGGGSFDEGDSGAMGGAPDITDTRLIGLRILPGISLGEYGCEAGCRRWRGRRWGAVGLLGARER
jgi:hypothetical protein